VCRDDENVIGPCEKTINMAKTMVVYHSKQRPTWIEVSLHGEWEGHKIIVWRGSVTRAVFTDLFNLYLEK